jgi:hypothetical protein
MISINFASWRSAREQGCASSVVRLFGKGQMGTSGAEQWIVYVLRCADGTLYTGVTTDLTRRLRRHNAGTASRTRAAAWMPVVAAGLAASLPDIPITHSSIGER